MYVEQPLLKNKGIEFERDQREVEKVDWREEREVKKNDIIG